MHVRQQTEGRQSALTTRELSTALVLGVQQAAQVQTGKDGNDIQQAIATTKGMTNHYYSENVFGKFEAHKSKVYEYSESVGQDVGTSHSVVDQTIEAIERGDGARATAPGDVIKIFQEYYANIYKADCQPADDLLSDFFRTGEFLYVDDGKSELFKIVCRRPDRAGVEAVGSVYLPAEVAGSFTARVACQAATLRRGRLVTWGEGRGLGP
ncbi:hypothetical protein NDU88_004398 [Pleurodeles waltl]|uniref:Uncharacterized protein n=1 Tax=Pleurodeles waltl TaxID=8319 RepID=A0AAV7M7F4_PLEWA|nr:hypothetical protein NDU88_004398 [Pleurodeles waltl]